MPGSSFVLGRARINMERQDPTAPVKMRYLVELFSSPRHAGGVATRHADGLAAGHAVRVARHLAAARPPGGGSRGSG